MADNRGRRRRQRRRKKPSRRKNKGARDSINRGDFISSLPNDILQHILSFIPTSYAIRTSVLSKRWRHVWYDTPSLYIEDRTPNVRGINQTLTYYRAPKIVSFHLHVGLYDNYTQQIDSWIEFAISRNVQNLSVKFYSYREYRFPDFFYRCSSIKQLSVEIMSYIDMFPKCKVSWESLRNLSLRNCRLLDESIAKILSGCPKLESLTLRYCRLLESLDLSKSPSLTRLEIHRAYGGPRKIVAPHIRYLRLEDDEGPCNLVDVSSLIESNLDIRFYVEFNVHETKVPKMLEKLQNVARLIVGADVPKIQDVERLIAEANVPISRFSLLPSSAVLIHKCSYPNVMSIAIVLKGSNC
ncbi:unnamed protein product [Microthlaspi erraticum]|uniref:F-box domain-containing protein n=1 Tax=Microthlaspi erraticum TaxID=1685480 RepID=A0A6D2IGR1_9BRAS|nr:unnamed protein product [Microthlaspi erraticum]